MSSGGGLSLSGEVLPGGNEEAGPYPASPHARPLIPTSDPSPSALYVCWFGPLNPNSHPHPAPRPLPFAMLSCLAQQGCKEFSLVHMNPIWPARWETAAQAQLLLLAITDCRTSCCTRSGQSSSRRSGLKSLRLTLGRVGPRIDSGRIWEIHPWGTAQGGL